MLDRGREYGPILRYWNFDTAVVEIMSPEDIEVKIKTQSKSRNLYVAFILDSGNENKT